ncbi:PspA/IM30 family protein [Virgibacillus halodenitrificans]|uniref:Phage shock protein A n=1 Tax=Virgibacillus halodenitrificans TaxID=1482 RepID=A0AAC9IZL0_VIRHA|nr:MULTISPECIES: PspA/IM30 family protein [Virgibacillus]AIF43200.1 phage-shock protein [Virgibacillus sp. SK37]APC48018.1 phage shock protein A [Virgibacillus halodenitrificans]MCG1027787.1 PspA/IM30 family protein [Virgibacillus halodenitrificans]MCJ0931759.1 PspA/IM30 family protein [Virgibacillus halodenitrificans]MEC2159842.1 PspA/IM30 family protein [Virgibacillus halodenitrificans]
MFKFFGRMKTVVSSELNAMLDKAEDPVKMLDQFMRDMSEDIREAEAAVAKQIANEKMLKRKANDAKALVEKRQKQAEQAIEAGNEDLARRALQDKNEHESNANSLNESWERAKQDADTLRNKLEEMKKEYQEMKLKKDSLKARAESARTRTKMNRTMSSIGSDDSKRGFERMEEKVMQYEAEAETSEDMSQSSRSLDDEFEELNNDNVDDELAALKKKMGKE